jgi:hypothetical protein
MLATSDEPAPGAEAFSIERSASFCIGDPP